MHSTASVHILPKGSPSFAWRPRMKKFVAVILIGSLPLVACRSEEPSAPAPPVTSENKSAPPAPQSTGNQVLANINGEDVTLAEIEPVLLDGYGLKVLLEYIELHLIRQQ